MVATNQGRIWPTVLGVPVISTVALALITTGGVGVLSMNPPAVTLAYWCFSVGYVILLSRIIWWAMKECVDSPAQKIIFLMVAFAAVGAVWYASWELVSSRTPVSLKLEFDSFTTAVGNLSERAEASTWNGEPWDENRYADIRLRIDNEGAKINNLDLGIRLVGEHESEASDYYIAAIGQTTKLHGFEFIVPQPLEATIPLRGKDNNTYSVPLSLSLNKGWSTNPPSSVRVIVPQLLDGQHLGIIIATVNTGPVKSLPSYVEIYGTGDALIGGNTRQGIVRKELVSVKRNVNAPTVR